MSDNQFIFEDVSSFNNHFSNIEKSFCSELSIFHANSRSLICNFNEFNLLLDSLSILPDIIVFSETHLSDNIPFDTSGFSYLYGLNKHSTCDGISIFSNNTKLSSADITIVNN